MVACHRHQKQQMVTHAAPLVTALATCSSASCCGLPWPLSALSSLRWSLLQLCRLPATFPRALMRSSAVRHSSLRQHQVQGAKTKATSGIECGTCLQAQHARMPTSPQLADPAGYIHAAAPSNVLLMHSATDAPCGSRCRYDVCRCCLTFHHHQRSSAAASQRSCQARCVLPPRHQQL